MTTLMVITGSTRTGRIGDQVTRWLADTARARTGLEVDLADLARIALPFLDEPEHPAAGRYRHETTKAWSRRVAAASAFALVTPEYNHSFPAPLKNALDHLYHEWRGKPAAIVSYGGVSAGTRAAAALTPVLVALGMSVTGAVHIPLGTARDADGRFHPAVGLIDSSAELLRLVELRTAANAVADPAVA